MPICFDHDNELTVFVNERKYVEQMRDDFYQTRNSFLIDATEKDSMQFRSPYAYVLSHLASQFRGSVTKPVSFHYLASPLHHPFW